MQADPRRILDDGFVVLRQVVPPGRLQALRACFEELVERQKRIWAAKRSPDDPPGGVWESAAQPRLVGFDTLIDAHTAAAVEFCWGETTLEASRQLMRAPAAAPTQLMLMCSPVRDHGPAAWHRDIHPIDQAPLNGLQRDLLANAPGYVQWNIPLYDDDVLWVVPGSHRRSNSEEENARLRENPRAPLPGGVPVELKAGDGVAYTNTILHWGSKYSARLRRTVHLGYRAFGGALFTYVPGLHWQREPLQFLSAPFRELGERALDLYARECDAIEGVFRALVARDEAAFRAGLEGLHPGAEERRVCLVLLSKLARKICQGGHPKRPGYGGDWTQDRELGPRFSEAEKAVLWERFAWLDERLQAEEEQYVPGFQSGPMRYFFQEMPEDVDVDAFVESWRG